MKNMGIGMLLVFVAWVPLIVWQSSTSWGPKVFGAERYQAIMAPHVVQVAAVVLTVGMFVAGMYILMKPAFGTFFGIGAAARVRKTGRPAKGILKNLAENSGGGIVTINDQPYLNLTVEVHDGYAAPYVVSFDTVVPRTLLPQLQPGVELPVKVDPQNPQRVVVDW